MAARRAHNAKVVGSIPTPASILTKTRRLGRENPCGQIRRDSESSGHPSRHRADAARRPRDRGQNAVSFYGSFVQYRRTPPLKGGNAARNLHETPIFAGFDSPVSDGCRRATPRERPGNGTRAKCRLGNSRATGMHPQQRAVGLQILGPGRRRQSGIATGIKSGVCGFDSHRLP